MSQPDFVDPGMLYPGMVEDYCVDPDGVCWPIPGPAALAHRQASPEASTPYITSTSAAAAADPAGLPVGRDLSRLGVTGSGTPAGFWLG